MESSVRFSQPQSSASMSDRGGSNTLRGGKNQYNAKTLNDNWVEDRYAPQFEGVRPNNATTAHRQDLEGGLRFRVDALCRFAMCCAATDHSPCSIAPCSHENHHNAVRGPASALGEVR